MSKRKKLKINYFSIILIAIFLVGLGILLYGGNAGWFRFTFNVPAPNQSLSIVTQQPSVSVPAYSTCQQLCSANQFSQSYASAGTCKPGETLINYGYQNQPYLLSCCCFSCSVSVDKTVIIEGEEVIGTITDGANTKCEIFMNKDNAGWIKSEEGITDANGKLVIMNSLMEGVYQFYAKCGSCTTSTLTITSSKAAIYKCCNPGELDAICRPTNCLPGEFASDMLFTKLTDCQSKCIGGAGGSLSCSEIVNPHMQVDCDLGSCGSGNLCTQVRVTGISSFKCECKTQAEFCPQQCLNIFSYGGRLVSSDSECNVNTEFPLFPGDRICCCNNYDIIGCGKASGSFGFTRNSLVLPQSTQNYCSEVAFADCQSTGKTVKSSFLVDSCCGWSCV